MRSARLIAVLAAATALASCSPQLYRITLKDGRAFLSEGKPRFQQKTGYYQYTTPHGREALIRADEVLMVEEDPE